MTHRRSPRARALRMAPVLLVAGLAGGCANAGQPSAQSDTASAAMETSQTGGWEALFDGSDLQAWRGYQKSEVPASWRVESGVLAFEPLADRAQRGDLVTREQYGDFELELEWKISEGGNSGVMYRVGEDLQYPWLTGPEMQVLDDERHPDGQIPSHRAGALYDLIVPPAGVARPVGEWNQARIVVQGDRIQHWLNGQLTADIEIGSEQWQERMAQSKFREVPTFASLRSGHIALQDHDDRVWYRNIRIRRLGAGR